MATCRNQSVSRRLVHIGLMGTTISLVLEGLTNTSMDEAQTSYIEQLIACISNLCASCEEAVEELSQRHFCPSLLQILSSSTLHCSIKRAAAQCLHTATENQVTISQSITGVSGGVDVLISMGQEVTSSEEQVDEKLCSLYCLGTLTNICGSLPCGDTVDLTQKMQQILPLLLSALDPSDEILNICISPTIDDELTETQQKKASELPMSSVSSSMLLDEIDPSLSMNETTVEMAEASVDESGEKGGDKDDGGEEVYVGGEVEKPWGSTFEVMEVAAEILANVAVILKEQCGRQEEEQHGDYEDGEWGDDEEDERRMETIAALKGSAPQEDASSIGSSIDLGVFDVRSAVGSCITVLNKLHTCVEVLVKRCDQENDNFSSSSTEILSCADKILTSLSNFLYLINEWTEQEVHTLMDLLLKQFNIFVIIFKGVTASNTITESNTSATNTWGLSSLLDHSKLQTTLRNTLSSNVCCLATLHRMPMDVSLLAMSNAANPMNKTLRGLRLVTLIRGISSVPFWEVTQHSLDMVSFLGSIELQFNEVKVISNTLLRRLSDPSALRVNNKEGSKGGTGASLCDASILVMEACVSSFIDLHSSDDTEIYSVST